MTTYPGTELLVEFEIKIVYSLTYMYFEFEEEYPVLDVVYEKFDSKESEGKLKVCIALPGDYHENVKYRRSRYKKNVYLVYNYIIHVCCMYV
jgi:hypothetical protein